MVAVTETLGRDPRTCWILSDFAAGMEKQCLDRSTAEPAIGYGHVALVYDFATGGEGDGWLQGLFRHAERQRGQGADTSFGAHIVNSPSPLEKTSTSLFATPPAGSSVITA